ncbi:MAG: hypothetical protein ACOYMN_22180 [Roseimicrobium sp.]
MTTIKKMRRHRFTCCRCKSRRSDRFNTGWMGKHHPLCDTCVMHLESERFNKEEAQP